MQWIVVDLDCTVVDVKHIADACGDEPTPGTEAHDIWRNALTAHELLKNAPPIPEVVELIKCLPMADLRVVFITNREEKHRQVSQDWMIRHGLYHSLFMRPNGHPTRTGEFKESLIKQLIRSTDSVLVIDDDPDGSIERVCKANKWAHLKVTTYNHFIP